MFLISVRLICHHKTTKIVLHKKKIERGGELKLSSPPLHSNLKRTNSIDLKSKRGNFLPSPLHIIFYGASNESNSPSHILSSSTHLVEHTLKLIRHFELCLLYIFKFNRDKLYNYDIFLSMKINTKRK
jgi:hypothetical protein